MNTHLFLPALREGKTVDMQDTGSRVPTNQLLCPDAVMHPNIYTPHHYAHYMKQENGHTQVKDIRWVIFQLREFDFLTFAPMWNIFVDTKANGKIIESETQIEQL